MCTFKCQGPAGLEPSPMLIAQINLPLFCMKLAHATSIIMAPSSIGYINQRGLMNKRQPLTK